MTRCRLMGRETSGDKLGVLLGCGLGRGSMVM